MPVTAISLNAQTIIDGAFDLIQAKGISEATPAADAADALRRLNQFISGMAILPLTFTFNNREVFAVTANVSTYTIGPGGDFNTVRPDSLTGAGLLLNSSSPAVEIPSGLLTDNAYEAIAIKTLTSLLWTNVYYNTNYAGGLGSIFLWPTPTTAVNSLVIYRGDVLQGFADLTTLYSFPPGAADMLEYGLAERLLTPYLVKDPQVRADVKEGASRYLKQFKMGNVRVPDAAIDPAMTHDRRGGYNILTGS